MQYRKTRIKGASLFKHTYKRDRECNLDIFFILVQEIQTHYYLHQPLSYLFFIVSTENRKDKEQTLIDIT